MHQTMVSNLYLRFFRDFLPSGNESLATLKSETPAPAWASFWLCVALFAFGVCGAACAPAQTMARRGWTGAGATAEPWWHRAVFYRIDPARFQASGDSSTGDLAGIALRLDYLQSLGVDALVLQPVLEPALPSAPVSGKTGDAIFTAPFDPDALESLIREASRHNLRILPSLTPTLEDGDRRFLLKTVHDWLGEGAAGIAVPDPPAGAASRSAYASLLAQLTNLLRTVPGERVLLTGSAIAPPAPAPVEARSRSFAGKRRATLAAGSGYLTTTAQLPSDPATAGTLRSDLLTLTAGSSNSSGYPLLRLSTPPRRGEVPAATAAQPDRNVVAAAAALLASRSAALFDFGAEIGLDTTLRQDDPAPLMQWTPTNVQQAPIERPGAPAVLPAPGQPTPFGAYKPFVRPPPRALTGTVPAGPPVELDRNIPPPPPDPRTLPGFTTGTLSAEPVRGNILNVATQGRDPGSVLNAFRDLLALRRGNPALREGTQVLLHPRDVTPGNTTPSHTISGSQAQPGESTLVFLRRAPADARTAGTVVVAANLGDTPLVLSLDAELPALGLHPGPLRALFSYGPQTLTGESTAALRLPPHAVFLGELRSPGR